MTEFVAATTALLMAYAIQVVFQSVRDPRKPSPPVVARKTVVTAVAEPAPVVTPPPAPARRRTTVPASAGADRGGQVRDPASGEIITMPTNYRFAKRWLKDALVTEGLLDRVYKPSELDDTANRKTREALEQFKSLPKYQV